VSYYPVYLNLKERKCLVVGGGKVAERKIRQLLKAQAKVTVVSPSITDGLKRLLRAGRIQHKNRSFSRGDTRGAFLVIAATSDETVNRMVSDESSGLINAVDMPEYCSFIMPSIIKKGPLSIAISTSGVSPAFARTLREDMESVFPADIAKYLAFLEKKRKTFMKTLPGISGEIARKRNRLFKKLGSREMLLLLRKGGFEQAKKSAENIIRKATQS